MKAIFVDTAGWMAMADGANSSHAQCVAERDAWLRAGGVLVSTDYVLDETLTLIRMRLGLTAARSWWELVDSSTRVRWEWIDASRAERAHSWFFRWKEQAFSFTDCTSFAVMKELRIGVALTSDRRFRRAGFGTVP